MRLPENENERAEFWTKVLFLAFVFALFIFVPAVFGARDKAPTPQSTSIGQELTVIVLPALEVQTVGERTKQTSYSEIEKTILVSLRANTAWSLSYSATGNLSSQPQCSSSGDTGLRNQNDNAQLFQIACRQNISWADDAGAEKMDLVYSVTPTLSE